MLKILHEMDFQNFSKMFFQFIYTICGWSAFSVLDQASWPPQQNGAVWGGPTYVGELASYTLLAKLHEMLTKHEKWKVYNSVFCITFFAFRMVLRQRRHSRETSKDFIVYFFVALMKCKIWMKYEKCIASVWYFVVCFAKTLAKHQRNTKYDKYMASHEVSMI